MPITPHNGARQYTLARTLLAWLKLEISLLLTYLTWQAIVVGEGRARGLPGLFAPMVFFVLGVTIVGYLLAARAAS